MASTIENWPGYENLAKKLLNIPQNVYDNMYKSYMPKVDDFNVITHGDMFVNNLLFRHDENGKPTDVRFVSNQNYEYYFF